MLTKIKIITNEIFQVSLITYLVFILIESFREGFVTMFFNINILLAIVTLSGLTVALLGGGNEENNNIHKKLKYEEDWFTPACAAIVTGVLVYFKIQNLGILAAFISIIVAVISFYLIYLVKNFE